MPLESVQMQHLAILDTNRDRPDSYCGFSTSMNFLTAMVTGRNTGLESRRDWKRQSVAQPVAHQTQRSVLEWKVFQVSCGHW